MSHLTFCEYRVKAHATKARRMETDRIYRLEREVSVRVSYLFDRFLPRVQPTHVSMATVLLVLFVFFLNFVKDPTTAIILGLIQLLILRLTVIGDHVDGELARVRGYYTQAGIYFDLAFHFFYPFVFIFSVGETFALLLGFEELSLLSLLVAFLMTHYRMLGKLRHHIRYKIELEGHQKELRDYRDPDLLPPSFPAYFRFVRYAFFFIYDWVWAVYAFLLLLAYLNPTLSLFLYSAHVSVLFIALIIQIFISYPTLHLFTAKELS